MRYFIVEPWFSSTISWVYAFFAYLLLFHLIIHLCRWGCAWSYCKKLVEEGKTRVETFFVVSCSQYVFELLWFLRSFIIYFVSSESKCGRTSLYEEWQNASRMTYASQLEMSQDYIKFMTFGFERGDERGNQISFHWNVNVI